MPASNGCIARCSRGRRNDPASRAPDQIAAVSAPDDDTVVVQRGPFVVVARLRREGVAAMPFAAHHILLTSEDNEFATGGAAPRLDRTARQLSFSGPRRCCCRSNTQIFDVHRSRSAAILRSASE
jgi:hypothetical protein